MKKFLKVFVFFLSFSSFNLYANQDYWALISFKDNKVESYLTVNSKNFKYTSLLATAFLIEAEKGACLVGSRIKTYNDIFSLKNNLEYSINFNRNTDNINYVFKDYHGEIFNNNYALEHNLNTPQARKLSVDNNLKVTVLEETYCKEFKYKNAQEAIDHPPYTKEYVYECISETSKEQRDYTINDCLDEEISAFEQYLSIINAVPLKLAR